MYAPVRCSSLHDAVAPPAGRQGPSARCPDRSKVAVGRLGGRLAVARSTTSLRVRRRIRWSGAMAQDLAGTAAFGSTITARGDGCCAAVGAVAVVVDAASALLRRSSQSGPRLRQRPAFHCAALGSGAKGLDCTMAAVRAARTRWARRKPPQLDYISSSRRTTARSNGSAVNTSVAPAE